MRCGKPGREAGREGKFRVKEGGTWERREAEWGNQRSQPKESE